MFYKHSHQIIYSACLVLNNSSNPIDIVTVTEKLKVEDNLGVAGGAFYITELTNRVASAANIEAHAQIIVQKYIAREAIRQGIELVRAAYEDSTDPFELVTKFSDSLGNLASGGQVRIEHISEPGREVLKTVERNMTATNPLTGIDSGFYEINKHGGGLQKGELTIIGAKTSQGKTALCLNVAGNAALNREKVGIFSLEMTNLQLAARMMSMSTGVDCKRILSSPLMKDEAEKLLTKTDRLFNSNIYFDKSGTNDISDIKSGIRAMVRKKKTGLIIVDYLQLITSTEKKTKLQVIGDAANDLKSLARILDIHIILVSQLRRSENAKPEMHQLKESGDIENAADNIWLLYRPDFYGEEFIEVEGEKIASAGLAHINWTKGRNCGVTEFALCFLASTLKFTDYQPYEINTGLPYKDDPTPF